MATEAQIYALNLASCILCFESCILCLESSTSVEKPLQISSFLTNKANFRKSQMNVNKVLTKDYENTSNSKLGENKANTKPNKANFRKSQMNVNKVLTKDYGNISNCSLAENKPNTNPIQTQTKPTCSELVEPISKAKKYCSPPFCCGFSCGEKYVF